MRFLRENWLWIVIPFLIVVGGMIALLTISSGDEGAAPFQYNVF